MLNRLLIFAIFLILSNSVLAQSSSDTINRTDEQGLKQGYWVKLDEEGVLKYEGHL